MTRANIQYNITCEYFKSNIVRNPIFFLFDVFAYNIMKIKSFDLYLNFIRSDCF